MHDVLYLGQFLLDGEELVSLGRILPFSEHFFHLRERSLDVLGRLFQQFNVVYLLFESDQQFGYQGHGGLLRVLHVADSCGREAIRSGPRIAHAHVVFEGHGSPVAGGDLPCNNSRVKIDVVFGDAPLVKPEHR